MSLFADVSASCIGASDVSGGGIPRSVSTESDRVSPVSNGIYMMVDNSAIQQLHMIGGEGPGSQ